MKTTMDLPDEIVREVKIRAVIQGRTVKDFVADLLREALRMPAPVTPGGQPDSTMVMIGKSGLPEIKCAPDAPATRMSLEELLALEQQSQNEEDLKRAGLSL